MDRIGAPTLEISLYTKFHRTWFSGRTPYGHMHASRYFSPSPGRVSRNAVIGVNIRVSPIVEKRRIETCVGLWLEHRRLT